MAKKRVNPTRMELTKLKKKLITARRGHKLLKDKRDELMKIFLEMVKENKTLRENVEEAVKKANAKFALASASMSTETLQTALLVPKQEIYLELNEKNTMSVIVPEFTTSTKTSDPNDIYSYGFAFTSAELDQSVHELSKILPDLLKLAETEKACQLMASEIEKTRRRVNALEHVMIPNYEENIKYISMKLSEDERSTQVRLMKVKDMVLEEQHHFKEKLYSQEED